MAANAQITVEPYSGARHQSFRQFEHLFRGLIGVAAIPANQIFCDSTSETPRYDIFKSYPKRPEMMNRHCTQGPHRESRSLGSTCS